MQSTSNKVSSYRMVSDLKRIKPSLNHQPVLQWLCNKNVRTLDKTYKSLAVGVCVKNHVFTYNRDMQLHLLIWDVDTKGEHLILKHIFVVAQGTLEEVYAGVYGLSLKSSNITHYIGYI